MVLSTAGGGTVVPRSLGATHTITQQAASRSAERSRPDARDRVSEREERGRERVKLQGCVGGMGVSD